MSNLMPLRRWAALKSRPYSTAREWAGRIFDPLPVHRVGRLLLVDPREADLWIRRQAASHELDLERLVDEIVAEVRGGAARGSAQ